MLPAGVARRGTVATLVLVLPLVQGGGVLAPGRERSPGLLALHADPAPSDVELAGDKEPSDAKLNYKGKHLPLKKGPERGWGDIWRPLIMSLVAGLSTVIGSLVVFVFEGEPPASVLAMTLGLAAGVMITVSVLELWPQGEHGEHGVVGQVVAFAVGAAFYLLVSCCVPAASPASPAAAERLPKEDDAGDLELGEAEARRKKAARLSVVLFICLTAHNFPEGLAVAMAGLSSPRLGIIVMVAIALHNIPEGLSIAVTVRAAGGSRGKAVLMALVSGLSEPLGAVIALVVLLPYLTETLVGTLMCFVAGVMVAVAFLELLPEAYKQQRHLYAIAGFALGCLVMFLTHVFGDV